MIERIRGLAFLFGAMLGISALSSCVAPTDSSGSLQPGKVFLADAEEEVFSEILQAKQRVVLQIELVDTVRPPQRLTLDGRRGYSVQAGHRRVQFRVLLPSTGWKDSGSREARGYFDILLVEGHRYQVAGEYDGSERRFHLFDFTTHERVSAAVDLGFFAPVRREIQYLPLIIPIKT